MSNETDKRQKKIDRITLWVLISLLLVVIGMLCNSCSCESRLSRVAKRCPSLLEKDTIHLHDTVTTKIVQRDTIFKYNSSDTIILKEGNMTVKYFYRSDSTVYLYGKCDTIRIIREIAVPYERLVVRETFFSWIKSYWWAVVLIIGGLFVIRSLLFRN